MPPKRFLILPLLTALFVIAETGFSQADTTLQTRNLFGPEQFLRTTGATNVYTRSFNVPSYVSAPYTLHIQNGQPNGAGRLTDAISSGAISINGTEIVHKSDFNQNVAAIDRTIALNAVNTLTVTLDSAPDSFILVAISGVINLGSLNQPRSGHTATLFTDGGVLIAGGQNSSGILASAERFDPLGLTFSSLTANMEAGRMDHSASALSDLTALFIAGQNAGGTLAGAELYDPMTGLFSSLLDTVRIPRSGHTATVLLDGRVLIVGGQSTGVTGSAETFDAQSAILFKPSFDPITGAFTVLPDALLTPRWGHAATLLPDGRVLITGGRNNSGYLSSTEVFDPATESFAAVPAAMTTPRSGHTATLMPDGRVLLLGGQNDPGYLGTAEWFDPAAGIFTTAAQGLSMPRVNHTATLLYPGEILITGGENSSGALASNEFNGPPIPDSAAPAVVQAIPSDGATGTDLTEIIGVRFSEPVDVTTLHSGTVQLTGSGLVDATIGPAEQGLMVLLVPKTKLSPGTTYTLSLTSAIRDTSGNPLAPFTSSLTTVLAPVITGVMPNHASGGMGVTITGQNFDPTAPTLNLVKFGGVEAVVASVTATQIETSVPSDATVGAGNLTVTTRGGMATTAFTVEDLAPTIANLSPDNGPVGTPVTITGQNFDPVPANNHVKFNGTAAIISSATATTIKIVVPQGAATGPVTVTTPQGTAAGPEPFEVTATSDFSLIMDPPNTSVVQSGFGVYVIRLASNGPDSFSVSLGVTGLPAGVDADFLPAVIAGVQESFLFITVADAAPAGAFSLNVTGTAMINGQPVSRQAAVTLAVSARPQTAFSGIVLDTNEHPLRNVTLSLGSLSTMTDAAGRFFLSDPPTGDQLLTVDGATANTAAASYPLIWAKVNIVSGNLNPMPYVIFLHEQKNYNFTDISNDTVERVVTDPEIPGFEMRIPAGVRIIGWDGLPNQKVSVQQLPIDRLPVRPASPADNSGVVYMFYFGKQGGGVPDLPIPVTLPNDAGFEPGEQGELWYFDEAPDLNSAIFDWKLAGTMTASQDGLTVATDSGVGIPRFCCGAIRAVRKKGGGGEGHSGGGTGGEPVFLNDGSFRFTKTDLLIPGRIPMAIRRSYNPYGTSGVFGKEMLLDYDVSVESDGPLAAYLIIPGEARFLFSRYPDGSFANKILPQWNGVVLRKVGTGYELTYKDGTRWTFQSFSGFYLLTKIEDRNGNRVVLTRDSLSRLTDVRDDFGRGFTLSYFSLNRMRSVTDYLGRIVNYSYDSIGRLVSVTDPAGGITQYEYFGNLISAVTDARGIKYIQNFYGASGRVLRQVMADGAEFRFSYKLKGIATSEGPECEPFSDLMFPPGDYLLRLWSRYGGYTINVSGGGFDLPKLQPDCPSEESYELYQQGYRLTGGKVLSTAVRDPNGNVTVHEFDSFGNPVRITDPSENERVFERTDINHNSNVSKITDAMGRSTEYAYDAAGNVASVTDAEGNTTRFEYEPTFNRVTQITDALGQMTSFDYDAKGNLTATTDPLGHTTTLTYTTFGQPETVTDPLGNTTRFEYDAFGNLTATNDPLGNRTTRTYDLVSRLIAMTDPLNRTTSYTYDLLNRVVGIVDPQGGVTRFGYDENGNLLTVTDANGNNTTHTYDVQDRLETRTDPLGLSESYQYDGNGNLVQFTDRKGQVSQFAYDGLNHRTQSSYADGSTTAFTYDAVSSLTGINDAVGGLIQMSYDDLNRLTQAITPQGVATYTYDAIGRRTSMSVNGLAPVNYQYDNASRLTQVAQGPQTVTLGYDTAGRRMSLTYPNGTATNYFYDNASRLSEILHQGPSGTIEDLLYTYDAAGNRISFDRTSPQTDLPEAITAAYNAANQTVQFNTDTLSYDANGNLTFDGTTTYTWDARNRLIQMSSADLFATFAYDAFGRRISKTINSIKTEYLYDRNDIVAEIQNGVVTVTYLRSLNIDEPFLRSSAVAEYYHTDALGSTLAVTDETGAIRTTYSYEPFGNTTISGTANANPFQYTGRENDGTGLYYYRARYYSPVFQRFISKDPSGFNGGDLNLYAYVANNPLRWRDPWGLDKTGPNGPPNPEVYGPPSPGPPGPPPLPPELILCAIILGCAPNEDFTDMFGPPALTTIGDTKYSEHALEQMEKRGIPPSVAENTIKNGTPAPGNTPGTTTYYDNGNNVTVVTNSQTGTVITVRRGPP